MILPLAAVGERGQNSAYYACSRPTAPVAIQRRAPTFVVIGDLDPRARPG